MELTLVILFQTALGRARESRWRRHWKTAHIVTRKAWKDQATGPGKEGAENKV